MRMEVFSPWESTSTLPPHIAKNDFLSAGLHIPATAFLLRPDLAVCFWESAAKKSRQYIVKFDCPVLRFSFILEGESTSTAQGQEELKRCRGTIEIRYFHACTGSITLAHNQPQKWLEIILLPSFLGLALPDDIAYLPQIAHAALHSEQQKPICESHTMTPEQFVAASQLAHCPYTYAARTLYLKSKTLELLSHVLAAHSPLPCRTRLSTYETECLKKARTLLIENLENPPSLRELALAIGLSETKLKIGFKTLFGQTVYGYFRSYRVDLARKRLLESSASISEVANSVGYTNISHFSAAFKARHGVTPSRYRKGNIFFSPAV